MEFSLFQGLVDNRLLPHRLQPFGFVIAECRVGRKAVLGLSLYYLFQVDGFLIRNELLHFFFFMFLPSPGTWTLLPSIVGTLLVFVNTKAVLKEAFHSNYYYNNCLDAAY